MARGGHGLPRARLALSFGLCPEVGPPLKQPYGCFWGGPSAGQGAYGRLLPFWTPHAVSLWEDHQQNQEIFTKFDATVRQTMLRSNITN
jgi:hypothetical protein